MTFKNLFEDVEDWFWKIEFNPETQCYELYLGIPNDWVYASSSDDQILIELMHRLEENSIIKIFTTNSEISADDIITTAKSLVSKNMELEKRKESHKEEMENLKNILIEKEKNFLEYIDTVKETKSVGIVTKNEDVNEQEIAKEIVVEVLHEVTKGASFIEDIEKLKLK